MDTNNIPTSLPITLPFSCLSVLLSLLCCGFLLLCLLSLFSLSFSLPSTIFPLYNLLLSAIFLLSPFLFLLILQPFLSDCVTSFHHPSFPSIPPTLTQQMAAEGQVECEADTAESSNNSSRATAGAGAGHLAFGDLLGAQVSF